MRSRPPRRRKPLVRHAGPKRAKPLVSNSKPAPARLDQKGKRATKNDARNKAWRERVKARFPDGLCQGCLERPAEHVHHVLTKASHPRLRWDDRNGFPCCAYCHDTIHAGMADFVRWWAKESREFAELLKATPSAHRALLGEEALK